MIKTLYYFVLVRLARILATLSAVVICIIWFANYITQIQHLKKHPELGVVGPFVASFINLPNLFQLVLPFLVLVAAILFVRGLSSNNELEIIHTSGVSIWRIIGWVAPGFVLGGYLVVILVAILTYEGNDRTALNSLSSSNGRYFWILSKQLNRNTIIKASSALVNGETIYLGKLVVFTTVKGRLTSRIDAEKGSIANHILVVEDADVKKFNKMFPTHLQRMEIPVSIGVKNVQNIVLEPEQIKLWNLPKFISNLKRLGLNAKKYEVYFYSLLTYPLDLLAMFILGCALVLKHSNRSSSIKLVIMGIIVGFTVHFISDVIGALGSSGLIPPFFTVAGNISMILSLGLLITLYREGI